MKTYVQIVDDWADEAVETIDVTEKSMRQIEKLISGIEINLNHEQYTVVVRDEQDMYKENK